MSGNDGILTGYRVGLFGKGGAGKSTVAVLLANGLRAAGYPVCVLDADSTNVGLHQALGLESSPEPLLEYFGGMVFRGGLVTCPVDDPTLLSGARLALDELPAEYVARNRQGIALLTAGKIGDMGPGAGCDGPVAKIARDLRISSAGAQPVMVTDFKAGFEDSARGAIIGLNWVVVVVDPTQAAMQMAVHMKQMISALQRGASPATMHLDSPELAELAIQLFKQAAIQGLSVVLNRMGDDETERLVVERLASAGIQPLAAIPEDPAIKKAWLRGDPLVGSTYSEIGARLVASLEAAVKHEACVT